MPTRDGQDDTITQGAMIALPVPPGTAARLVHPDGLPANDLHVTLAFLGPANQLTSSQRTGIHEAAREAANVSYPLPATIPAGSGTFNNPDEQPYWFDPGCPAIHGLRDSLMSSLQTRGLDHLVASNHPFTPHITIKYLSPDEPSPTDREVPSPAPATFTHLNVVLGDELPTSYPLGGRDVTVPESMTTTDEPTLPQNAASPAPRTVRVPISPRAELSLRRAVELHNRTAPLGHRASLEAVKAVYSRASRSPDSRVASFLTALSQRTSHPDDDLFPAPYTPTGLGRVLTLSQEYGADEVRSLVVTASAYPVTDPLRTFHLSRALVATAVPELSTCARVALAAGLRALIADGNSTIARSLRAKRQLRDRFGKWIEMGGGVRFKIKKPGSPGGGTWYHGKVEGIDVPNGRVDVRLEDGSLVKVPADKVEQPKAILKLPGAPETPEPDDPNAPEITPESVNEPTQATLPPASVKDVLGAADDSANQLLNRVPSSSTASQNRDQAISSVDQLMGDLSEGSLPAAKVVDGLHQVAESASAFAQTNQSLSPQERDAFRAYADDLLDVAAGIDPSHDYAAGNDTQPPTSSPAGHADPLPELQSAAESLANEFPEGEPLNEKLAALSNTLGQLILQKDTLSPEDRTKTLKILDSFIDKTLNEHLDELGPDGEDALTDIQSGIVKEIHAPTSKATLGPKSLTDAELDSRLGDIAKKAVPWATQERTNSDLKWEHKGGPDTDAKIAEATAELGKLHAEAGPLLAEKLSRVGPSDASEPYDSARWSAAVPGDTFATTQDNPDSTLTGQEIASRRAAYVGQDTTTITMNASLRSGNPSPEAVSWRDSMNELVDSSVLKQDTTFGRGGAFTPEFIQQLVPGATITDHGVMSVSRNSDHELYAARRQALLPGTVVVNFEILAPAGTHAVNVSSGETVLASDTSLRVHSVTRDKNGGYKVVASVSPSNNEKVVPDDTTPAGATPEPGGAPEQPGGSPNLDGGGPAGNTDLLGNPVPDGLATLFGERTLPNGTTVQDYVIPSTSLDAKNGFSVMVGEKNGEPVYALKQAFGAHLPVGNFSSWDEVSARVNKLRGDKSTADEKAALQKKAAADVLEKKISQHEALKLKNWDDAGRPLPEGWSRDITPEGQTVYTGPGRYRAVNADDSPNGSDDLILLVRMPNDTFATVDDFPDWPALVAGVKKDMVTHAKEHRDQFAKWLVGHGFTSDTAYKVRNLPNVNNVQVAIASDPRFSELVAANEEAAKADFPTADEKQDQKAITELKSFIQGLQPVPDQPPAPQEAPPSQTQAYPLSPSAQGELADFIDHFSLPPSTDEALDSFLLHGDSSKLRELPSNMGPLLGEMLRSYLNSMQDEIGSSTHDELSKFSHDLDFVTHETDLPAKPSPVSYAPKLSNEALDAFDEFIDSIDSTPELNQAMDAFIKTGDASKLLDAGPDGQSAGFQLQNFVQTNENDLPASVADELDALAKSMIDATRASSPQQPASSPPGDGDAPATATATLATPQHDVTSWTLVSGQKGYNQGGTYQAPDGQQYYVKVPSSPAHAHNEVLTSALYSRLGVPAAEVTLGTYGPDQQLRIVSKIVPGAKADLSERLQDKTYIEKIQAGFAIDAWLANWDVVGPKYDNIVSDASGNPYRIDGGGALLFRGAGGKKNTLFGHEANEITTLRSFGVAPKPSKVYGPMGEADVKESVKKLLTVTPEDIATIVDSTGFDAKLKGELAWKLASRREFLLKKYGLFSSTPDESEQASTKLTDVKLNDPVQQPAAAGKVRIAADGRTQLEIGMKVVSTKDGTTGVVFKHDPSDKYVKIKRDSDGKVIARATKTLLPVDTVPTPAMTAPAAPAKSPLEPPFSPSLPPVKKSVKKVVSKKAATAPQPQLDVQPLAPWEQELLNTFIPAAPPTAPDLATTSTFVVAGKAVKKGDELYAHYNSTDSWVKSYVEDVDDNGALYLSKTPGGPIDKTTFSSDDVVWPNTIEAKKTQEATFKNGDILPGFYYPDTGNYVKVGDDVKVNNGDPSGPTWKVVSYGIDPEYGDQYVKLSNASGESLNAMSIVKVGPPTAAASTAPPSLGQGYATLGPNAVPMYVNKQTKGVIVVEPAGTVNHYDKYGAVSASWGKLENYGKNPNWEAWSPAAEAAPKPKLNNPSWETWTPENSPTPTPPSTTPPGPPPGVQSVMAGDGNLIYPGVQVMGSDGAIGVVKSIEPNGTYVKVKFPSGTKARAASKLKLISGGSPATTSQPAKLAPKLAEPTKPVPTPEYLPDGTLDGPSPGNTANLSKAVAYVTASTENAVQGISVATDSGDVEELDVRMMRVKVDGQERLLLKFKLTSQAGDLLVSQQEQLGTWKKRTWKLNKFSRTPGKLLYSNSLDAGVDGVAGSNGKLRTLDLDNGAHIEHRSASTGAKALHNMVEIYLPVDADEKTIRQSLLAAGVRTPDNAAQQDVTAFIENRMISMLDNFSDPTMNKKGTDRQASLDRIAKRYGVTAESFTVEHGPGGRIDVVAPPKLRDQLSTQTGVKALVHNVSVKGASLTGAASNESKGERYVDFLEKFFTDKKGLRSTVNRWTEGVVTNGMSSSQDINTGGADYVFFRPNGSGLPDVGSTSSSYYENQPGHPPSVRIMVDPRETIFRNLAWNANSGDSYGKRLSGDILARTNNFAHEIMPKDSVAWEQVHSVRISKWYRDALVDRLKKKGITMVGGRTVEQFFASDNEPIISAPGMSTAPGTALPPAIPGTPAGEGTVTP